VLRRPCPKLLRRPHRVCPQREGPAVWLRGVGSNVGTDEGETVIGEPQVPDQRGAKAPHCVSHRGDPKARRDRRFVEASSDAVPALQDERSHPCPGQIRRADQPVVPGADDYGVILAHPSAHAALLRSLSNSSAAILPGAPMMPPPGWVEEPQSQSPFTGVRNRAHPGTGRLKKSCSRLSSPWKMLPSVRPRSRSTSSGVSTCR